MLIQVITKLRRHTFVKRLLCQNKFTIKTQDFFSLANLGTIKKATLDFEGAEQYYLQAFSIAKELKDEKMLDNISSLFDDLEYMKQMNKF